MKFVKLLLDKTNLLDHEGKLSLSNLAVIVCVAKVAVAPDISLSEIGALLLALLNYAHKRFELNKKLGREIDKLPTASFLLAQIETLKAEVKEQIAKVDSQAKILDEAKNIMVAQKLSVGMKRQQL